MKKMFCLLLFFTGFITSCASQSIDEHQRYLLIKGHLAGDRYSNATVEIVKLEKDYPDSQYLCELWGVEIADISVMNGSKSFIEETKKKRQERCLGMDFKK
ncbi:hypothetical protein CIK05_07325 [Bdellovibrio sp. qaytius]|nr:hypothetical protein CIK05_07325 [Bdellovibrio sp. qaytius]